MKYSYEIKAVPENATVEMIYNGKSEKATGTTYVRVDEGTSVDWYIYKDGYTEKHGTKVVVSNVSETIQIKRLPLALMINPNPSDSYVKITYYDNILKKTRIKEGYGTQVFQCDNGETPYYVVSKDGYKTVSEAVSMSGNSIKNIELKQESATLTVSAFPSESNVKLIFGSTVVEHLETASIVVPVGSEINYEVSCEGYQNEAGTLKTKDSGLDVSNSKIVSLLKDTVVLEIKPSVSDCEIILTAGDGKSINGNKIAVKPNTNVQYVIRKSKYNTITGNILVVNDTVQSISMVGWPTLSIQTNVFYPDIFFFTDTNYDYENDTIQVPFGTKITYAVSKENYYTQSGEITLLQDTTIDVELIRDITITVKSSVKEATVKLSGNGKIESGTETATISVPKDTVIEYSVSCDGYTPKTGEIKAESSRTITTNLTKDATITIVPYPNNANVKLEATGYKQDGNTIVVPQNTKVSYIVSLQGYKTVSGELNATTSKDKEVKLGLDIKLLEQSEFDALADLGKLNYVVYNPSFSDMACGEFVKYTNQLIGMINGFTDAYQSIKLLPEDLNQLPSSQIVKSLQAIMIPLNTAISTINSLTSAPVVGSLAAPVVDALNGVLKVLAVIVGLIVMVHNGSALWIDAIVDAYKSLDIKTIKEQFNVGITPGINSSLSDIDAVDFPDDEIANDIKSNASDISNELSNVGSVITTLDTYKSILDELEPLKFENLAMQLKSLIDVFNVVDFSPFNMQIQNYAIQDPAKLSSNIQSKIKKFTQIPRKYIHKDDIAKLEELKHQQNNS